MKTLKRIFGPFAVLLAALLVAGCSTMKVSYDFNHEIDFRNYKSYKWLEKPKDPKVSDIMDSRIRAAVEAEFDSKGIIKVENGRPDFLVTYETVMRDRVDVRHYSYGTWWGPGGYVDVDRYKEGTLMLDIVDPDLNQLVWRGWAVDVAPDPRYADQKVREAANRILKRFPPK